jgi:uncharacterized protein (DUF849 family)
MLLKVCVNGARGPHEHPALPVTAETMAEAAVRALAAGADAVHLHVRGAGHAESLQPDDVARTVEAVRARCGTVPIGVTTGAWIEPDLDERLALIRDWILLPDFASVNLEEEGVFEVCRALIEKGVGVEAGIGAVDEVGRLARSGLARSCLRILIEPVEPDAGPAIATVRAVDAALEAAGITLPRLTHGFEATTWPVLDLALALGHDTRIGLEDTLHLPDGRVAADNAALVEAARTRVR